MEIPFDYILISIMINLKNRKVKAEVSKQSLIKTINKIIFCYTYLKFFYLLCFAFLTNYRTPAFNLVSTDKAITETSETN